MLSDSIEGQRKDGGVGLAYAVEAETREAKMESNVEEGDRGKGDCFLRRLRGSGGHCVEQPGSDRDDNGGQAIKVTRAPRKSRSIHCKGPKSKVLDAVRGGEIECGRDGRNGVQVAGEDEKNDGSSLEDCSSVDCADSQGPNYDKQCRGLKIIIYFSYHARNHILRFRSSSRCLALARISSSSGPHSCRTISSLPASYTILYAGALNRIFIWSFTEGAVPSSFLRKQLIIIHRSI